MAWLTISPKIGKLNLKTPIQNVKYNITLSTLRTSSNHSSFFKTTFVPPTAVTKILRHGFTENTIQKVYLMSSTVTNEVKITMFQFKAQAIYLRLA